MSSKFTFYIPSSDGKSRIHGVQWAPSGEVKALVQVTHGMIEHIGRYDAFAAWMNRAGIAVIGHDHLGHGLTARPGTLGQFAETDGAAYVLEDIRKVAEYAKRQYPGVPHILLGHSMGSFFGRRFIALHGELFDGAIFMGTGSQSKLSLKLALFAVKRAASKEGRPFCNEKLHQMVLGSYNKSFESGKTEHQWLSRDEQENRKYEADPYCQFKFSNGAYEDFFQVMYDVKAEKEFDRIPKELPVLFISGEKDPVGENGKGVKRACDSLKKHGLTRVEMKLYPEARHELLNELNREEVCRDIEQWVFRCC